MIQELSNTLQTEPTTPVTTTQAQTAPKTTSIEGKFELIYKELQEIRQQRTQYEKTVNELTTVIHDYKVIVENLIQENIQLKTDTQILHDKFEHLEYNRDMQEQANLNHNLIINGAPEVEQENTKQQILDIATALQVDITENDIKTAVRKTTAGIQSSGFPRAIVVTFNSKEKRDLILRSKLTSLLIKTHEKTDQSTLENS